MSVQMFLTYFLDSYWIFLPYYLELLVFIINVMPIIAQTNILFRIFLIERIRKLYIVINMLFPSFRSLIFLFKSSKSIISAVLMTNCCVFRWLFILNHLHFKHVQHFLFSINILNIWL